MKFETTLDYAKHRIDEILGEADYTKSFVALDIDATVLTLDTHNRVHPVELGLYIQEAATRRNLQVVYITARLDTPDARRQTYRDLNQVGITNAELFLRPSDIKTWEGISTFKADQRRFCEEKYKKYCILNAGDQWTDLIPSLTTNRWDRLSYKYDPQKDFVLFRDLSYWDSRERWALKLIE